MQEQYHTYEPAKPQSSAPPRQIEAIKSSVRLEDVAGDYGSFRLAGDGRLLGRCISPDHEDHTPSMTIYTDEQKFKCFGCQEHGDVIDFLMLAEGMDQVHDAIAHFVARYGVDVPARPDAWFRKQSRQAKTRAAIEETKKGIVRRRLFRHLILPLIDAIEDEAERNRELERAWSDFQRLMP